MSKPEVIQLQAWQSAFGTTQLSHAVAKMDALLAKVQELERDLEAARQWTEEDQPLPEDEAIEAARPMRTQRHDLYHEAMRMVGAKRSKYALVDLVNWLLAEREAARRERDDLRRLVMHCWIHSGYPNCGYMQMTSEQKLLFDAARREQTPQAGKEG